MENTKRYTGSSMTDILDRVKVELGRDAIIYQSSSRPRRMKGGMRYEVVAGAGPGREPLRFKSKKIKSNASVGALQLLVETIKNKGVAVKQEQAAVPEVNQKLLTGMHQELKDLKLTLQAGHSGSTIHFPEKLQTLWLNLYKRGGDQDIVNKFCMSLNKSLGARIHSLTDSQMTYLAHKLIEKRYANLHAHDSSTPSRIKILVGPTGSGKTTTLAKMASRAVLQDKQDVILISLDDYRLGAHAQLKSYADILAVPFYTIHTPQDLERLIRVTPGSVQMYIDTSGVSPNNTMGIQKIASYIKGLPCPEVYLALMTSLSFVNLQVIQD